jgi:hypothetical protein
MNKLDKTQKPKHARMLEALHAVNDRALPDQIRRPLALPIEKRTHFPRIRRQAGGSHL